MANTFRSNYFAIAANTIQIARMNPTIFSDFQKIEVTAAGKVIIPQYVGKIIVWIRDFIFPNLKIQKICACFERKVVEYRQAQENAEPLQERIYDLIFLDQLIQANQAAFDRYSTPGSELRRNIERIRTVNSHEVFFTTEDARLRHFATHFQPIAVN